jgi:hypothetical protein
MKIIKYLLGIIYTKIKFYRKNMEFNRANLIRNILQVSDKTIYNYKNENRPIMDMLELFSDVELAEFLKFGFISKLTIPNIDEEIVQFQNIKFEQDFEWEQLAFFGLLRYMGTFGIWENYFYYDKEMDLLNFNDIDYTCRLIETCKYYYPKINFSEENKLIDLIIKTDYKYIVYYNLSRHKLEYLDKSVYGTILYNYVYHKFIKKGILINNNIFDEVYNSIENLYEKCNYSFTYNKKTVTDLYKYDKNEIKVNFDWDNFENIIEMIKSDS